MTDDEVEKIIKSNMMLTMDFVGIRQDFQEKLQRPWVGLTDEELQPIADEYRILFGSWVKDFARAIEAKLKDKNK